MSCKAFLIKMVKKRMDKSPLTYPLVRYMNFLDPGIFIAKKETTAEKLRCILHIMSEAGHITDSECDKGISSITSMTIFSLQTLKHLKVFQWRLVKLRPFILIGWLARLI